MVPVALARLPEALIVNPYDTDQCAEALDLALGMPIRMQRARMRLMRALLQEFNVGNNSAADLRAWVDTAFGTQFHYSREAGAQRMAAGRWLRPERGGRYEETGMLAGEAHDG